MRRMMLILLLCLLPIAAIAQWQAPNHAVPIGKGAGVTGFGSAAPGTAGCPLVSAGASSDPAFTCGAWTNTRVAKTANYTAVSADCGSTIALAGATYYTLTLSAPSGYTAPCVFNIVNENTTRAKLVSVSGGTDFRIYPGQTAQVYNQNNVWIVSRPLRWRLTSAFTQFYVNSGAADDTQDCLAAGTGNACKTIQAVFDRVFDDTDAGGNSVVINMSASTFTDGLLTGKCLVGNGTAGTIVVIGAGSGSTSWAATGNNVALGSGTQGCTQIELRSMTLTSGGIGILAAGGGISVSIGSDVVFGAATTAHFVLQHGAFGIASANYTVSGGSAYHVIAQTSSTFANHGRTVTCSGSPAFSAAFYAPEYQGFIDANSVTYSGCGTTTGPQYALQFQGLLDIRGSSGTMPGSVATSSARNNSTVRGFTVPAISGCGTSPSAATGSDFAGQVTEGTSATGCTITFATASFASTPVCTLSSQAALTSFAYTLSTSAITITHSSASSTKINWTCAQD